MKKISNVFMAIFTAWLLSVFGGCTSEPDGKSSGGQSTSSVLQRSSGTYSSASSSGERSASSVLPVSSAGNSSSTNSSGGQFASSVLQSSSVGMSSSSGTSCGQSSSYGFSSANNAVETSSTNFVSSGISSSVTASVQVTNLEVLAFTNFIQSNIYRTIIFDTNFSGFFTNYLISSLSAVYQRLVISNRYIDSLPDISVTNSEYFTNSVQNVYFIKQKYAVNIGYYEQSGGVFYQYNNGSIVGSSTWWYSASEIFHLSFNCNSNKYFETNNYNIDIQLNSNGQFITTWIPGSYTAACYSGSSGTSPYQYSSSTYRKWIRVTVTTNLIDDSVTNIMTIYCMRPSSWSGYYQPVISYWGGDCGEGTAVMSPGVNSNWFNYTLTGNWTRLCVSNTIGNRSEELIRTNSGWLVLENPSNNGWFNLKPGPDAPDPTGSFAVHFKKPNNWSNAVNIWYWGGSAGANTDPYNNWPGTHLTGDTNGWYTYVFPAGTNTMLIFNNNGSPQTEDLALTGEGWLIWNGVVRNTGVWYDSDPE